MTKYNRLKGAQSTTVEFATPVLESTPTYPHAYFAAHPGKPPVLVPKNSKAALTFVKEQLHAAIYVTAFLYEHLEEFPTVKLDKEWKSYGVVIGKKDEDVGPTTLLTRGDAPDI
jgi:hypothetical protein